MLLTRDGVKEDLNIRRLHSTDRTCATVMLKFHKRKSFFLKGRFARDYLAFPPFWIMGSFKRCYALLSQQQLRVYWT